LLLTTKSLPFKVNYGREPIMGFEIKKKGKYAKSEEFVNKMKKMYKKVKVALKNCRRK